MSQKIKYDNKKFIEQLIQQYYLLRSKNLCLFQGKITPAMKKSLIEGFVKMTHSYSDSHDQLTYLKRLVHLYKKENIVSTSQQSALYCLLMLNTFYKNKPGYFSLDKMFVRKLNT